MSYVYKRPDCRVVACDICEKFSYIGDRQFHPMPHHKDGDPMHLCTECRSVALWCPAHAQYHLPHVMHRYACAECGGLFTSVVRDQLTQCPACRRASGQTPARPATPVQHRSRSWLQVLFSPRAGHHS